MKASVIIPSHRSEHTLPATLASIRRAAAFANLAEGEGFEIVVSEDPDGNGVSWARNRGLERARGEYVFFVDADDTVREGFFARPLALMESSQADFCIFGSSDSPLKRDYSFDGNAAIRAALLPAYIGYSWRDVWRRLCGGSLWRNREPGSVWRHCFRRDFLERWRIRFNERLFIYEDAPFLCECAIRAERMRCLDEVLYDYTPGAAGLIRSLPGTAKHWAYKREIRRERERLNRLAGGTIRRYYAASQFLGRFEFLRHALSRFDIISALRPSGSRRRRQA